MFFHSYALFGAQYILHYVPHFSIVVDSFLLRSFYFFLSLFSDKSFFFVLFGSCRDAVFGEHYDYLCSNGIYFSLGMHHLETANNQVNMLERYLFVVARSHCFAISFTFLL